MFQRSLVALFALAGGLAAPAAHAATVRVDVGAGGGLNFVPRNATIRVGDTVEWTNFDTGMAHNVLADGGTFTSGSPDTGPWTYRFTFTATGTFPYYCVPHGSAGGLGMAGNVIVLDSIELAHGSDMNDDLAGAADRYRIGQKPYSSYEVVVDALAGNPLLELRRVDATGTTVLQTGDPVSATIDMTQSLRWQNSSANVVDTERIRVQSSTCPTNCSANDVYRIRAYETTLSIPRYNQSGSQISVVILQNPTNYSISGTVYFWNAAGQLLNSATTFTLLPKQALVQQANGAGLPGTSGTITVSHTGRYGDLTGKAVALESSTGFSFDTPAVVRPR